MLIQPRFLANAAVCAAFAIVFSIDGVAQGSGTFDPALKAAPQIAKAALPKVTQVDIEGLRKLLKPNGRPLLINFWATWCDPCREEFPDLVKLDAAYRGRIDLITVSLDEVTDINTYVPKFLGEMKAEMPAYLLKTFDESAAITMVSKEWNGNLPLTILISPAGDTAYLRKGKIRYGLVADEINKVLALTAK